MAPLACVDCLVREPCQLRRLHNRGADDVRLVARFLCGDLCAEKELLGRLRVVRRVIAARNGRMGSPWRESDIDDLAQETIARVFQGLRRFEGRATLETGVARIAELVVLEALRARERARFQARERAEQLAGCSINRARGLGSRASGPVRAARGPWDGVWQRSRMGAGLLHDLAEGLGALTEGERELVDLRVRQEMTFEQVGSVLGLPPGTAKTRYHRAIHRLRTFLSAHQQRA